MALRHPLFVSGASAGVTEPQDARLALASLLTGPGILTGGTVTGSTSGPNMIYSVAAGSFATARGVQATDGLYVVPNDGPATVDSGSPAPGSGTRWDLIWVRCLNAFDGGFGDANSDPVFGVTVGTAGSSPSKPYSSVPAGALVLAESNVGTSIASASLATISMVAVSAGTLLPRAAQSGVYPASPAVGTIVDDASAGGLIRWNGTAWVPASPPPVAARVTITGSFSLTNGTWAQITGAAATFTVDYDPYSLWSPANNVFFLTSYPGLWRAHGRLVFPSNATGYRGVGFAWSSAAVDPNRETYLPAGGIMGLEANSEGSASGGNQYVRLMGYQSQTGGAAMALTAQGEFSVEWLGPLA
ncbi:MAG TPA: hypothetical protein VFM01_06680 [Nakamurella sp.]|nr:hypothetical protein [Nakamurella sp.]